MRNVLAIPAVLLVAVSSLSAQASLELAVSRATLRQSFAYDCCGPTRRTSGAGLGFRITWPAVRLIEALRRWSEYDIPARPAVADGDPRSRGGSPCGPVGSRGGGVGDPAGPVPPGASRHV